MKKRILTLCLTLVLLLSLFVPLAFANEECEHNFENDGDCTTPATCTLCGIAEQAASSHNFDNTVSYSYNDGNFVSSGEKTVACSNKGCTKTTELEASPLISSLGYSIREYEKADYTFYSLTSSYVFNSDEIESYANSLGKSYEYGIICYIPSIIGEDEPVKGDGDCDVTVLKLNYTGSNGVNDLTLPSIIKDSVNDQFVFAAYFILGGEVVYIQSGKIFTDYKELGISSCSLVLDKLNSVE